MATNSNLFSEFGPTTKKEWIEKAIEDLKGTDFDKKLVWKTDEGFSVQPFYTKEDLQNIDTSVFRLNNKEKKWDNFISLNGDNANKANQLAKNLSSFDINGILFSIEKEENIDFKTLLAGIDVTKFKVAFKLSSPSATFVNSYFKYLESSGVELSDISGFIETDPLATWTQKGSKPDFDALAEQLKVTSSADNFKGLTISSLAFVNAGANIVQELAFTLNKITDLFDQLIEKGISVNNLSKELHIHFSIGGNYFFEIAKLRAFRVIAKEVFACYNLKNVDLSIFSSSSNWSKSIFDPEVNLLRNTTEAMSAILGGTGGLLINPHDSGYQNPSEFSHRIALNISAILKEESYFNKVEDPSSGSYYIEEITKEIAENTISLFQEIEAKGGFISAFKKGIIQDQIHTIRSKKETEFATRKRVIVGTNKYPNQQEKDIVEEVHSNSHPQNGLKLLTPQRMTKSFDEMRKKTIKSSIVPKVMLVCFGNLAMRKARASFSSEFFGTAGFEILGEFFYEDINNAAKEASSGEADIVVICSSDDEYGKDGLSFAKLFNNLSPNKKLIVAGYPSESIDHLAAAGVDSFIHMKTNVIEFIGQLQNELL